jgi:tRNA nucleotidyltransferase/poly(A) polymerase
VTLEQDLARRDLTINAIARDEDGTLIDPFGGAKDLREGVLRHVSEAFHEDPVRILRVARFAARFGFRIADETMTLMKYMVDNGEADHLVAERVWQEFYRGLAEPHAERMFEALERCDFRPKLLSELKSIPAKFAGALPVRFAHLCWPLPEAEIQGLCERLRVPNEERELALLACRCKAMRKPKRAAKRATRRMRTGSSWKASLTWRSTPSRRSRSPPNGSMSLPSASLAMALMVRSRRARSCSSVTSGAA